MAILLFFIIFFGIIGGVGFLVYRTIKKLDNAEAESGSSNADTNSIDSAQKFLPFEDIKDNMIILGNFKYRMVIECSSVNYALKTDEEQEIIELGFQRIINSFDFPFTFYIQTKEIDNRMMINSLKEDIAQTSETFKRMSEYGEEYIREMENLTKTLNQTKQKKKYIIIPFDDAAKIVAMDKNEKYTYALTELRHRAKTVQDALSSLQIKARILDNSELIELLYNAFHKDGTGDVNPIISGEYMTTLVEGVYQDKNTGDLIIGNRLAHMEAFEKMFLIFKQAEKWIQNEVIESLDDADSQALAEASLKKMEELRDATENAAFELYEKKKKEEEENDNNNGFYFD